MVGQLVKVERVHTDVYPKPILSNKNVILTSSNFNLSVWHSNWKFTGLYHKLVHKLFSYPLCSLIASFLWFFLRHLCQECVCVCPCMFACECVFVSNFWFLPSIWFGKNPGSVRLLDSTCFIGVNMRSDVMKFAVYLLTLILQSSVYIKMCVNSNTIKMYTVAMNKGHLMPT